MKILVSKSAHSRTCRAWLVNESEAILASSTGPSELAAIGQLVKSNPFKFRLREVKTKYGVWMRQD